MCREQEIVVHQPKIKMSELMSACLDVVERGGKEVVRVRGLADIGIRTLKNKKNSMSKDI
jgi:hypothetical protein